MGGVSPDISPGACLPCALAILPVFAFLDSQHLGAFLGGDGVGWLRGNALGNACFGGLKEKRGGRE